MREKAGAFAEMKIFAHADDVFHARDQPVRDEISVAGMNEGALKIIITRRRGVLYLAAADINATVGRVARDSVALRKFPSGFMPIFQRREPHHRFENGAGGIILRSSRDFFRRSIAGSAAYFSGVIPCAKSFGSNAGDETRARMSPVWTSITTAAAWAAGPDDSRSRPRPRAGYRGRSSAPDFARVPAG